ncbi:spermidine synthase [Chelativorans sp. YIM 93263]|uniref:spermidine synthase n=1 Tax=Chelativorans sp. YIM 93263 TaxID=2906648 RepID=UPI002378C778|nr:spermidine synthase [Chelativorans sp. YIM 93263]
MSAYFQELDYQITSLGGLSLRRRRDLASGEDIYEIKLNEDFLMSSQFTTSEKALATLGLGELSGGGFDVVVGGLGLGYTAAAALEKQEVQSLVVVDALRPVIEWHEQGMLPLGSTIASDSRCRLVHGDFFAMAREPETGFDPHEPGRRFDAILLDIDHSPRHVLDPENATLYTPQGLKTLSDHLTSGGVFALWSNEPEDLGFTAELQGVFEQARAERVVFYNPLQEREVQQAVYLARKGKGDA